MEGCLVSLRGRWAARSNWCSAGCLKGAPGCKGIHLWWMCGAWTTGHGRGFLRHMITTHTSLALLEGILVQRSQWYIQEMIKNYVMWFLQVWQMRAVWRRHNLIAHGSFRSWIVHQMAGSALGHCPPSHVKSSGVGTNCPCKRHRRDDPLDDPSFPKSSCGNIHSCHWQPGPFFHGGKDGRLGSNFADVSRSILRFFFLDKSIQVEVVAYKSDKARDCRKGFDDWRCLLSIDSWGVEDVTRLFTCQHPVNCKLRWGDLWNGK